MLEGGLKGNFKTVGAKNGIRLISGGDNGHFGGIGTKVFIAPDCNIGLLTPREIRERVWGIQTTPPSAKPDPSSTSWEELQKWFIAFERTLFQEDQQISQMSASSLKIGSVGRCKICTISKDSTEGKYMIAESQHDILGNGRIPELESFSFKGSNS